MRGVHGVGWEMLERIKEERDLPSGTPGYILWAQGPKGLREGALLRPRASPGLLA